MIPLNMHLDENNEIPKNIKACKSDDLQAFNIG